MKKQKICISLISLALVIATIFCLYMVWADHHVVFSGSRLKNPDYYILQFDHMNQNDSHTLALHKGDELFVDFKIARGDVDLIISQLNESTIYTGNRIDTGTFILVIPEDASYQITVNAKNAYNGIIRILTTDAVQEAAS